MTKTASTSIGWLLIGLVIAGTAVWVALGRPMPTLDKETIAPPVQSIQVPALYTAALPWKTQRPLPSSLSVQGRTLPVERSSSKKSGFVCQDTLCVLFDPSGMQLVDSTNSAQLRKTLEQMP